MNRAHEVIWASYTVMVHMVAEILSRGVYPKMLDFPYVIRSAATVPVTMVIPRLLKGNFLKYCVLNVCVFSYVCLLGWRIYPQTHVRAHMLTQAKSNYWFFCWVGILCWLTYFESYLL